MINLDKFYNTLYSEGVEFFSGVPDSYLNGFCNYLLDNIESDRHIVVANEGNAVAIASGHYFATKTIPLVYMQNSGIGNALNPLVSLVDRYVYSVPMILLIGWRGEPLQGDHPQHRTQGIITPQILEMLDIPYVIAENDDTKIEKQTKWAVRTAKEINGAVAIIGKKGVFSGEKKENLVDNYYPMSREEAIETILDILPKDTIYAATTGRATRELYFLREKRNEGHQYDFLNVGSMGHASSVAQGIALSDKSRNVVCLDGDSAAMMHMGAMTMASKLNLPNFLHIVLNNGAHESVGGQPSAGHLINFTEIAEGCGYITVGKAVTTKKELIDALHQIESHGKAAFIDVRIHKGLRGELPPLQISHGKLIKEFMSELQKSKEQLEGGKY